MAASASDAEYATALAPAREQATASSSQFGSALDELIVRSKCHRSELAEPSDCISVEEEAAAKLDNRQVFKALELFPEWGEYFATFDYDFGVWESLGSMRSMEVGEEGTQAELFHAHTMWRYPMRNGEDQKYGTKYVVKVFKKRTLVQDLSCQWPQGLFQWNAKRLELMDLGKPLGYRRHCDVVCAMLLEDGRFAFLMIKEHEDLESFIDCKVMETGHGCGPFSKDVLEEIMYRVALRMDWLHSNNIVHRGLKASNVLVKSSPSGNYMYCFVADHECLIGVVGTGFWRAHEILQACKLRNVNERGDLFTRAVHAYSYGMTCYEILIGKPPFENHP